MSRDLRAAAREAWRLRALPFRVARFQLRAQRRARREGDAWTLTSTTALPALAEPGRCVLSLFVWRRP